MPANLRNRIAKMAYCYANIFEPMPSEKDESRFLTRFFLFIFPEHRFRSVVQMFILDHILKFFIVFLLVSCLA